MVKFSTNLKSCDLMSMDIDDLINLLDGGFREAKRIARREVEWFLKAIGNYICYAPDLEVCTGPAAIAFADDVQQSVSTATIMLDQNIVGQEHLGVLSTCVDVAACIRKKIAAADEFEHRFVYVFEL